MKRGKKKLRARLGMTLSEVLVALLIFSLVSVGMAAGISAAARAYKASVRTSEAQTLCSTLSQAMLDILRGSDEAVDGDDASGVPPKLTHVFYGQNVSFSADEGKITLGGKQILGSGAYTDLSAAVSCTCSGRIFTINITISDSSGEITSESFSARAGQG